MDRWIRKFVLHCRSLLRSRRVEAELDEELRFHLERETAARVGQGLTPLEARRSAMLALDGLEPTKERCRDTHPFRWAADLDRDFRYAIRSLRRTPAFTVVALTTLALGIGANTTMFSVLNTYLLRPLPYPQPDRLVRIWRTAPQSQNWPHSAANFLDLRDRNDVFEYMVAVNAIGAALIDEGQAAERLQGFRVTADFFPALRVQPALGRTFTAEEDQPGSSSVVVLSDRFWRRRFGGDLTILGRTLRLDGENVKVIGVMPPGFDHPIFWGPVDIWRPLAFTPEQRANRLNNYLAAFARLKPGVSLVQAQEATAGLFATIADETKSNFGNSLRLEPMQRGIAQDTERTVMWFAFGLAAVVLLIACVNLANLQLVRTAARAHEHSIRAALGAERSRLLRQSLTESLVVAVIGGAVSLVVALAGIAFINGRLFDELPGARVALDVRVFAFTLFCSVVTGLVFGTMPAWLASRSDVNPALKQHPRGSTSSAHLRLRHMLIVGEVAFALVLLTGAGLFLRGLNRFAKLDAGWKTDGLLTGQLELRGAAYATPAQRLFFYRRLEERLLALPGVEQVALATSQAAYGFQSSGAIFIEGQPEPARDQYPEAFLEPVSLRYFDTLGIRIVAGRAFEPIDTSDRPPVVVINEAMAKRFWPNENPIGKRIARVVNRTWMEVVGVVNDVRFPGNVAEPYTPLQAFRPLAQSPPGFVNIALRTSIDPELLADALRRAVTELDASQPVQRIRAASTLIEQGRGRLTLLGTLLGAFAALGLILASVGIYGVTSYAVAQRTAEFGIRLALGAPTTEVLSLVMTKGTGLILAGVMLGLAGAYGVSRVLTVMIPTLPTRDPVALIGISIILTTVALVACYVPARRATRLDPLVALRHE